MKSFVCFHFISRNSHFEELMKRSPYDKSKGGQNSHHSSFHSSVHSPHLSSGSPSGSSPFSKHSTGKRGENNLFCIYDVFILILKNVFTNKSRRNKSAPFLCRHSIRSEWCHFGGRAEELLLTTLRAVIFWIQEEGFGEKLGAQPVQECPFKCSFRENVSQKVKTSWRKQ